MEKTEQYNDLRLVRKLYAKNIVLVTGVTRAGKSMLSPIISSFKRAELVQINGILEQMPMLNNIGLLSDDVAVFLLRHGLDYMLLNLFIGRNTNFRFDDMSSAWKHHNSSVYFKRLFSPEGSFALEQIEKLDPVFVWNIHYGLWHVDILLKAFPDMKMLHVKRHPVDVVYSWHQKGYGGDFFETPRNQTLTVQGKSMLIPYHGIGIEDLYESSYGVDRIIYMINRFYDLQYKNYKSLPEQYHDQVKIVSFEEIVTNTSEEMKKICSFLDMEQSSYTPIVLERERCPRVLSDGDRQAKQQEIKELASEDAYELLLKISKEYEMGENC